MNRALKYGLPPLLVVGGIGVLMLFKLLRPAPERKERVHRAPLVEVEAIRLASHRVEVEAFGTLIPAQRVVLQAEVSGRIVWQSPKLAPGGRFEAGDTILRVDPRDYEANVDQVRAELRRAQLELETERGRQRIAKREYELFEREEDDNELGRALALREPQLDTAQVGLSAAKSKQRKAKIDLQRTTLKAPFNAVVQSENVDLGQLVGPQTQLAVLVGSDEYWAQISVPIDSLPLINVPGVTAQSGAPVMVVQSMGNEETRRKGQVVKLLSDVDAAGGMARLLVSIKDPLGGGATHSGATHSGEPPTADEPSEPESPREEGSKQQRHGRATDAPNGAAMAIPLLLGSYVKVEIEGRVLSQVARIPRAALREGRRVMLVDKEDRLRFQEVEIAWRNEKSILVKGSLKDGDRIITSAVPTPVAGMKLRLETERTPPQAHVRRTRPEPQTKTRVQ